MEAPAAATRFNRGAVRLVLARRVRDLQLRNSGGRHGFGDRGSRHVHRDYAATSFVRTAGAAPPDRARGTLRQDGASPSASISAVP